MGTRKRVHQLAAVAVTALVLLTTGCGKVAEKASEKATEKALESAAGEGVDVDLDGDGNVEVKTADGSYSTQTGKVPGSWPEDIPLPEDLVVLAGTELTDASTGATTNISGTTSASVSEIKDFYIDAMSGWTESMNSTSSTADGEFAQLMYENDGRMFVLIASVAEGETQVNINHTESTTE